MYQLVQDVFHQEYVWLLSPSTSCWAVALESMTQRYTKSLLGNTCETDMHREICSKSYSHWTHSSSASKACPSSTNKLSSTCSPIWKEKTPTQTTQPQKSPTRKRTSSLGEPFTFQQTGQRNWVLLTTLAVGLCTWKWRPLPYSSGPQAYGEKQRGCFCWLLAPLDTKSKCWSFSITTVDLCSSLPSKGRICTSFLNGCLFTGPCGKRECRVNGLTQRWNCATM